jgi:hypothetical protein
VSDKSFGLGVVFSGKDRVSPALRGIKKEAISTKGKVAALSFQIKGLGGGIDKFLRFNRGGMIAATGAMYGMSRGIMGVVDAIGQTEIAQKRMEILTGSTVFATKAMKDLKKMSVETTMDFPDLIKTAEMLQVMGTTGNALLPTLKQIGDLTLGDPEKAQQVTYAYGLLRQNSVATMRELKMFTTSSVPIMAELEKVTGRTGQAFRDFVRSGGVTFQTVQTAMSNMTAEGGAFHDGMKRQMSALQNLLINLGDAYFFVKDALGSAVLPGLKSIAEAITEVLKMTTLYIEAHRDEIWEKARPMLMQIGNAFAWIGLNLPTVATWIVRLTKFFIGFIGVMMLLKSVAVVLNIASAAMFLFAGATWSAMAPVLVIALLVVGAIAAVMYAMHKLGKMPSIDLSEKIKGFTDMGDVNAKVDAMGKPDVLSSNEAFANAGGVQTTESYSKEVKETRINLGLTDGLQAVGADGSRLDELNRGAM